MLSITPITLSREELAIYEWQLSVPDVGVAGQERLKGASVLISRVGGLGGVVAYELAAAGVGRLLLAHGGTIHPADLNRQLLMTHDGIGKPRLEVAVPRLRELNPYIEIEAVSEQVSEENAMRLVGQVDLVIDCAPLFSERFAMNRAAVLLGKPMIECAMYELEAQLTTIIPGSTPCLACLYPEAPPAWTRQFPVFGAVSGTVGCLAAMEAIKLITGIGEFLTNKLLLMDLRTMAFRRTSIYRNHECAVCGGIE